MVFLILFAVWLVFSGHFDALHLALGLACSALVAVLSSELLLPQTPSFRTAVTTWRVLRYLPWLLYQIVLANLHVVYLVWRPGQLRPQIVQFRTGLTSDLAIDDDEFTVHAVSDQAARSLRSGEMERRVGHVFLEPDDPASTNDVSHF